MKRLEKSVRQKQMTQEGGRCVVNVHLPGGGCGFLPALCPDSSTGEQQGVVSTPVLHKFLRDPCEGQPSTVCIPFDMAMLSE